MIRVNFVSCSQGLELELDLYHGLDKGQRTPPGRCTKCNGYGRMGTYTQGLTVTPVRSLLVGEFGSFVMNAAAVMIDGVVSPLAKKNGRKGENAQRSLPLFFLIQLVGNIIVKCEGRSFIGMKLCMHKTTRPVEICTGGYTFSSHLIKKCLSFKWYMDRAYKKS